jgi:oligoendopeptidase F
MSYNPPLQWDHPMQLAETASTFNQLLMTKKMLADFTDPEEKLTLIEYGLEEDTQVVVDILCRFLFEKKVVETPLEQPLSADDMKKMMLEAQDESYGDGLDPNYKHPYMWLCKGHYYSAGLNFYNWPYAFGMLYARGLYAKYLENKEEFVKNYDEMLRNTCKMDVEDVAKTMGIDITKKAFWLSSLKQVEEDIAEFKALLKQTKKI